MNKKPIIAVLGATGQVGQALYQSSLNNESFQFSFFDRQQVDLGSGKGIDMLLESRPDAIINAAAYTAVDKAEKEIADCIKANAIGVAHVAKLCYKLHIPLIHISSDYVYDSVSDRPIKETDPCKPRSIYAISKLHGDLLAMHFNPKTIILRTSWVYAPIGHNFVKTMLKLSKEKTSLNIVSDQIGAPTYAPDLAEAIMTILSKIFQKDDKSDFGVFNLANRGFTSWNRFAETIFSIRHLSVKVHPIRTIDYNAPAPRPLWSVMDMDKIQAQFGIVMPEWETSLNIALAVIEKNDIP